jgi:hypothetical protein
VEKHSQDRASEWETQQRNGDVGRRVDIDFAGVADKELRDIAPSKVLGVGAGIQYRPCRTFRRRPRDRAKTDQNITRFIARVGFELRKGDLGAYRKTVSAIAVNLRRSFVYGNLAG